MSGKQKLYLILTSLCIGGYLLLIIEHLGVFPHDHLDTVCFFKLMTSIPCPACGSSRALLAILGGEYFTALMINPLGYLASLGLLVLPFWLIIDFINRKESLFRFYGRAINYIQRKPIAISLIALVMINWVWNISKGL